MAYEYRGENSSYHDPLSGVQVTQLTDYLGHSNHAYFTHPGWLDGGRALLFVSDRNNTTELCRVDLESGVIRVLTEARTLNPGGKISCHAVHANPCRPEACLWAGRTLHAVSLEDRSARALFTLPEGFVTNLLGITADGRYVCCGVNEDPAKYYTSPAMTRSERREALLRAKPHSRIYRIPVDGGKAEIIHDERYLIGHINTSPTRPDLLTFCHEGPWGGVDQRIWGLDIHSGKTWPIRLRDKPYPTAVGHEYWLSDGEHIGFHGQPTVAPDETGPDKKTTLGCIRYDNRDHVEFRTPGVSGHTHSLAFRRIVGDGGGVIRLWDVDGNELQAPRTLCAHHTLTGFQRFHPHPAFHPDGRRVLFVSSRGGYSQLYLADVPDDISTLPEAGDGMPG